MSISNKVNKYIHQYSLNLLPSFTILLSIMFITLPLKVDNIALLMPLVTLVIIYFWAVYWPQSLPYFAILLLGLFKDLLESNILGLNALYFLLFLNAAKSQIKYIINNSFIVVWAGFIFCLTVTMLLYFLMISFSNENHPYHLTALLSKWLVTSFAYAPMHWLLSKVNNLRFY
jgi:rod shape-determining protein MreD